MDFAFSTADLAFRDEVRRFIAENFTPEMRAKQKHSKNGYLPQEDQARWQKALCDRGWIAPNWPKEYGGPGFTPTQRYIFEQELNIAGTPIVLPFGPRMVAPVIMKFGTPEQKARYLPRILSGEDWWCQGYSEPGAGSDLASLQMKAEDKGDHYLVNGTKIWTTRAQFANMIFCLVRTAKTEKPQEGISFILIDMKTPGITVQPIVTLDQSRGGLQEINTVFFEDVKVPKENRIGEENKGWTYAKYLLEFERGSAYSGALKGSIQKLKKIAKEEMLDGRPLSEDEDFSLRIADLEIQISALEFTELRIFGALSTGANVGPESSLLKTRGTEIGQAIQEMALEAVGYYAFPFVENTFAQSNEPSIGPDYATVVAPYYFNGRKTTIYAGSNEIQRNIMAKLVLGL